MSELEELASAARIPSIPRRAVPSYRAIIRGSGVLRSIGIILYCCAAACFICVGLTIFPGKPQANPNENMHEAVVLFLIGVAACLIGALISMVGAVGLAIRDIAINSFGR